MKEAVRRIQRVLIGNMVVGGGGVAYMQIFQPGHYTGTDCLILYMFFAMFVLIIYAACFLSCGSDEQPLDPVCQRRCVRLMYIGEAVALAFLFACLATTWIW